VFTVTLQVRKHNTRCWDLPELQLEQDCRQGAGTQGQTCHLTGRASSLGLTVTKCIWSWLQRSGLLSRQQLTAEVTGLTSGLLAGPAGN